MTSVQRAEIDINPEGYLITANPITNRRLRQLLDQSVEAEFRRVVAAWAAANDGYLPTRLRVRQQLAEELRTVLAGLGSWIHAVPSEIFVTHTNWVYRQDEIDLDLGLGTDFGFDD